MIDLESFEAPINLTSEGLSENHQTNWVDSCGVTKWQGISHMHPWNKPLPLNCVVFSLLRKQSTVSYSALPASSLLLTRNSGLSNQIIVSDFRSWPSWGRHVRSASRPDVVSAGTRLIPWPGCNVVTNMSLLQIQYLGVDSIENHDGTVLYVTVEQILQRRLLLNCRVCWYCTMKPPWGWAGYAKMF